jgi:hypothetical protein
MGDGAVTTKHVYDRTTKNNGLKSRKGYRRDDTPWSKWRDAVDKKQDLGGWTIAYVTGRVNKWHETRDIEHRRENR